MIVIVTIVIMMTMNNRNATVSVLVKLLPYLITSLGLHAVFIFHGLAPSFHLYHISYLVSNFSITKILAFYPRSSPRSVCALGALFVWLFVPETSGKTLSQLASIYKKDSHLNSDC